jgi:hypothetical protein
MVELMKPGSVIVDLAAEAGGNCELTRKDEVYVHNVRLLFFFFPTSSALCRNLDHTIGVDWAHFCVLGEADQCACRG